MPFWLKNTCVFNTLFFDVRGVLDRELENSCVIDDVGYLTSERLEEGGEAAPGFSRPAVVQVSRK